MSALDVLSDPLSHRPEERASWYLADGAVDSRPLDRAARLAADGLPGVPQHVHLHRLGVDCVPGCYRVTVTDNRDPG